MARVHCIQHDEGEGPGAIATWAAEGGHELSVTRTDRGEPLPVLSELDLLVILGGGMNVDETDRHPWLLAEKRFITAVIGAGRPILGICLGSQLLAEALGGTVARNPEAEIGWFPVRRSAAALPALPEQFEAFHWHERTWTLPPGAVHLAESDGCPGQAFMHGDRLVGVQFHPEMTPEIAAWIAESEGGSLPDGRFVQAPPVILADPRRFSAGNAVVAAILDHLVGVAGRADAPR